MNAVTEPSRRRLRCVVAETKAVEKIFRSKPSWFRYSVPVAYGQPIANISEAETESQAIEQVRACVDVGMHTYVVVATAASHLIDRLMEPGVPEVQIVVVEDQPAEVVSLLCDPDPWVLIEWEGFCRGHALSLEVVEPDEPRVHAAFATALAGWIDRLPAPDRLRFAAGHERIESVDPGTVGRFWSAVLGAQSGITPDAHRQRYLKILEKADGFERVVAAEALGALGATAATPDVLATLLLCLESADWDARLAAAEAFGALGPAAATPEVLTALAGRAKYDERDVREAADAALQALSLAATTNPAALSDGSQSENDNDRTTTEQAFHPSNSHQRITEHTGHLHELTSLGIRLATTRGKTMVQFCSALLDWDNKLWHLYRPITAYRREFFSDPERDRLRSVIANIASVVAIGLTEPDPDLLLLSVQWTNEEPLSPPRVELAVAGHSLLPSWRNWARDGLPKQLSIPRSSVRLEHLSNADPLLQLYWDKATSTLHIDIAPLTRL